MAPTIRKRGQNLKISGNKKKTKYKHNATKSVSSGRGTKKTLYWDQSSGSWKSTKNKPIGDGLKTDFSKTPYKTKKNYELSKKNVNESSEKKLKKIRDARKMVQLQNPVNGILIPVIKHQVHLQLLLKRLTHLRRQKHLKLKSKQQNQIITS